MVLSKLRQVFRTYPLVSNMMITSLLYAGGDVSQQTVMGAEKYNWAGTGRVMTIAFLGFGPLHYYWYRWLDKVLPGQAVRIVIRKLFADQLIASPPRIFLFFVGISFLEGKEDIFAEFREKALKTFATGSVYWPMAQSINFFIIPPAFRAVYVGIIAFIWSNVLCFIKSGTSQSEANSRR